MNVTQGAAYGAALLAGVGAGVYTSVPDACARTIHVIDRIAPGSEGDTIARYESCYRRYRELYPALSSSFTAIAGMEAGSI